MCQSLFFNTLLKKSSGRRIVTYFTQFLARAAICSFSKVITGCGLCFIQEQILLRYSFVERSFSSIRIIQRNLSNIIELQYRVNSKYSFASIMLTTIIKILICPECKNEPIRKIHILQKTVLWVESNGEKNSFYLKLRFIASFQNCKTQKMFPITLHKK